MVPMLTCGLVRSNLALATVGPPQDSRAGPPVDGFRPEVLRDWFLMLRDVAWEQRPRSLALALLDDLVGHSLRDLRVAVELHRVHRAARGLRPQVTDVAEHLRQRDVRTHDLHTGGVLHGLDLAAARDQVADDVAHVLLGSTDLDAH